MTLIVYINTAGNQDSRDNDLFQIDAAGFLVDMGCVLVDHCSHAMSAASRIALQRAIRRIKPGDTLVVARLGYLGSSISDAVSTLTTLAAKGAHVICLEAGKSDLCASGTGSPIRMLQLAAGLEHDAKRARALDAAAIAKKDGTHQGRPASLSDSQRQQALNALAAGSTVTAIARALSTSRQTIIRLRDAASRETAAVQSPPVQH
ncbi:putative DNA-invertase from lambdoid prophage Rac [Caballeronia udeis]|uniref:DNA-invertase from lambdoid prophage Rac n=1 Tax=Caballeronia udeis TaxID=1232866 RepID=A0ABW8MLB1_9BURK